LSSPEVVLVVLTLSAVATAGGRRLKRPSEVGRCANGATLLISIPQLKNFIT